MSDLLNENQLVKAIVHALDDNLRGQARRNYVDAHDSVQPLVVEFVNTVSKALEAKFQN